MRIVNRKEFMSLPSNTLFAKFIQSDSFGELRIKTSEADESHHDKTNVNDFVYMPFVDFVNEDLNCEEVIDYITQMIKDSSLEFNCDNEATQRDGLYDDKELYVVFNRKDIHKMINNLLLCIHDSKLSYKRIEY